MEKCWLRLSLPAMEKELIHKWYTFNFLHDKSAGLYTGRMKKRFLNDEDGMVLALELDFVGRKLSVVDNILREAKRKDIPRIPHKRYYLWTLTNESPEGITLGEFIVGNSH